MPAVRTFVALGDSFTEGVGDPDPSGSWRGWADRFAGHLDASSPGLRYANLAIRGKAAAFNAQLRQVAIKHHCLHVDLWSMRVLADPRDWCEDRLHLAPDGHRRVALRACEVAGVDVAEDWREPLRPDPAGAPRWISARRQDIQWARTYAAPWLSRRLRGVSSGDAVEAKRPGLLPL